jgi:hypothetical protein
MQRKKFVIPAGERVDEYLLHASVDIVIGTLFVDK